MPVIKENFINYLALYRTAIKKWHSVGSQVFLDQAIKYSRELREFFKSHPSYYKQHVSKDSVYDRYLLINDDKYGGNLYE